MSGPKSHVPKSQKTGCAGRDSATTTTHSNPTVDANPEPFSVLYPTDSGQTESLCSVPACALFYEPSLEGKEAMRWLQRF